MLHSFSVFEIQKMRNNLKASKSYPHDLKEKVDEEVEEDEKEAEQVAIQQAAKEEVKRKKESSAVQSVKSIPSPAPVDFAKKPESQLINVRL